jgi:hypothetical protein
MIVPSQLALKTHTNFGCAASLATLDKLIERFPLPSVAPPIGDTSLTHVMRLAAHSTTSSTPTALGQSFIATLHICIIKVVFEHKSQESNFFIFWLIDVHTFF